MDPEVLEQYLESARFKNLRGMTNSMHVFDLVKDMSLPELVYPVAFDVVSYPPNHMPKSSVFRKAFQRLCQWSPGTNESLLQNPHRWSTRQRDEMGGYLVSRITKRPWNCSICLKQDNTFD